jgi:hypothetical protein
VYFYFQKYTGAAPFGQSAAFLIFLVSLLDADALGGRKHIFNAADHEFVCICRQRTHSRNEMKSPAA